jgi:hypothetical protein
MMNSAELGATRRCLKLVCLSELFRRATTATMLLSRLHACRTLPLLAVATNIVPLHPAFAQQGEYAVDRELRERGASLAKKDFSLTLNVPLLFTSSVLGANSDGMTVDKPDWHLFPDAQLKWSHQFDWYKLTVYGAISADRYLEIRSEDVNAIEGGFLAEMTDGKSDLFIPYLSYIGRAYLDRNFRSLDDNRHDFAIGAFSGTGWRGNHAISYSDAVNAGDQSLGVDVQFGRREANAAQHQNTFASLGLDYTYTFAPNFWLVLGPKVRVRWYEDYFDEFRRDIRLSVIAKAVWQPDWLTNVLPKSRITFSVEHFKNASTDEFNSYSLWELGATLRLSTHF